MYIMHNDRDVIVNFDPGEYTSRMFLFFQSVTQAARKKKIPNNPNRIRTYDLRGLEVKFARLT